MPETTDKPKTATKPAAATKAPITKEEPDEEEAPDEPETPSQKPPHIVMRALLGFAGLSLLVGFFMPWLHHPASETTPAIDETGFNLAWESSIQGTPSWVVWLVPVLGAALSAASFMGFRYAAQAAIGVSVAMLAYALWVLGSMFVQSTAFGLWTVAGGTFVILLLGVTTYMLGRRGESGEPAPAPKKAAAKS